MYLKILIHRNVSSFILGLSISKQNFTNRSSIFKPTNYLILFKNQKPIQNNVKNVFDKKLVFEKIILLIDLKSKICKKIPSFFQYFCHENGANFFDFDIFFYALI